MRSQKALLGMVLVAVGTILLLDTVDLVESTTVLATWWPVVFIAAGVLAMTGRPPTIIAGGLVLLFGLAGLGVTTGLLGDLGWGMVWALVLIAGGLWFILGRGTRGDPQAQDEQIDVTCLFSGRKVISTARPFTGGSITGIFGGVELDLTGAVLRDGAVLDAIGIFGGAEITVPPGWNVRVNGPAIFGALENKAEGQHLPDDAPTLNVRALALFGGVEVQLGVATPSPVSSADSLR